MDVGRMQQDRAGGIPFIGTDKSGDAPGGFDTGAPPPFIYRMPSRIA